ncbi:MAG: molybdenum cofactor biosynthesis protein MoaE [Gemmatimonadales bacterium]
MMWPCCRRWPGGEMTSFLRSQAIDVEVLEVAVSAFGRGATVTFVGTVRDHHVGRAVMALEYSAFDAMAEKVAAEIHAEAMARWPVEVAMAHRIGDLAIGDVAVAVAVASAHRDAAFEACRWIVDSLKTRVPIWKRERYADGTEAWVDPTTPGGVVPVSR